MREAFAVEIEGTKPYLQHAFKGESRATKKRGVKPTIEEDCEEALYRDANGHIYVPSMQLEASMKNASTAFKFKGRSSYYALVVGGISVEPLEIPMNPQKFEPFVTGVVIGHARVMKARPMFKDWRLGFRIISTDERLTEAAIKEILTEAGQTKGIGDWRPKFGLYKIHSWRKELNSSSIA